MMIRSTLVAVAVAAVFAPPARAQVADCAMERYRWEMDKNSASLTEALDRCMAESKARAAAPPPADDKYEARLNGILFMCDQAMKLRLAQVGAGAPSGPESDVRACIDNGRANGKAIFDRAMRATKSAKAKEALKSAHVAFISAIEGIVPEADERRGAYEQRQAALKGKHAEAWARYEVEK